MNDKFKLMSEIIARSKNKTWQEAVKEWYLVSLKVVDEPQTCICGHFPIKQLCIIEHDNTGEQLTLGNHCITHFLGLPVNKLRSSVKRVTDDITKSFTKDIVDTAWKEFWIDDWEYDFYKNIIRKRKLSPHQMQKKVKANVAILKGWKESLEGVKV